MLEAPKVTVWPTILAWSYVKSRQLSPKLTAVDLNEHNLIQWRLALISGKFIGAENCPFESTIFWWLAFYWVQSVIFCTSSLHPLREGKHHNKNRFKSWSLAIHERNIHDRPKQNWNQQNSWHWNNLLQLFSPHLLPDEGLTNSFLLLNIFSQNLFPIKKPPSVIYKFVNT